MGNTPWTRDALEVRGTDALVVARFMPKWPVERARHTDWPQPDWPPQPIIQHLVDGATGLLSYDVQKSLDWDPGGLEA